MQYTVFAKCLCIRHIMLFVLACDTTLTTRVYPAINKQGYKQKHYNV